MTKTVLCLRPEADFLRVGVTPPKTIAITYMTPADPGLADAVKAADAIVMPAVGPKLAPELFEGARLKLVQVTGAGIDRLDLPALKRRGIPVANVPGGSNNAVAEYCVGAALDLLRRMSWSGGEIKRGRYVEYRQRMLADNLFGLDGATVGVVGLGTIGMVVAEGFAARGSRIVYFDPKPPKPDAAKAAGWTSLSLDALLAEADVVTLHVPLIPATTGLIGATQLSRMKKGAFLINAARGGIVDEAALAASLTSGHLGGAAVDVYSTEPPPADNPLLGVTGEAAERLLLTPHIAGVTRQSSAILFRSSWQNVERVLLEGGTPSNVCT
jgi:phosphoglycerate dehydrogenase-like enzyme